MSALLAQAGTIDLPPVGSRIFVRVRRQGTERGARNGYRPAVASSSLVATLTILKSSACRPGSARKESLPK